MDDNYTKIDKKMVLIGQIVKCKNINTGKILGGTIRNISDIHIELYFYGKKIFLYKKDYIFYVRRSKRYNDMMRLLRMLG